VPKLIGASCQRLTMCLGYETTVRGDIVLTGVKRTGTYGADLHELQGASPDSCWVRCGIDRQPEDDKQLVELLRRQRDRIRQAMQDEFKTGPPWA
jgi:hypothetical protein